MPFGIAINGVLFDPGTAEFWKGDRTSGATTVHSVAPWDSGSTKTTPMFNHWSLSCRGRTGSSTSKPKQGQHSPHQLGSRWLSHLYALWLCQKRIEQVLNTLLAVKKEILTSSVAGKNMMAPLSSHVYQKGSVH